MRYFPYRLVSRIFEPSTTLMQHLDSTSCTRAFSLDWNLAGGFKALDKYLVKMGIFSPSFAVNMKKTYIWNHNLYEIISTSGTFKHPNSSLKWLETPGVHLGPCENQDAARYENNLERRPLQDRSTPAMPCRSQSSSADNNNFCQVQAFLLPEKTLKRHWNLNKRTPLVF